MVRFGNPQEVEEYFADGSVNQSYLKQLIKGVDYLGEEEKVLYYEEKGHFKIGSAVDVWLTQGKDNYEKQYFSSGGTKPSDSMISMVRMIFDNTMFDDKPSEFELEDIAEEHIINALEYHKWQSRWKMETKVNKVKEEGAAYFEELKQAHGKIVLSALESMLVTRIVMSLQSGKYTNGYFKESKNIDIFYQVPIYFNYKEVPCKTLLDMVVIDHNNKLVYPIDIKTMGEFTTAFPWAVKKRGYHIQAAFYTEALTSLTRGNGETIQEFPNIEGYKITKFRFLVETTKTKESKLTGEITYFTGKPMVYILSDDLLKQGKEGKPAMQVVAFIDNDNPNENTNATHIKYKELYGFDYAIGLHKWHTEHGFEEDKEVFLNNGLIEID